MIDRRRLLIAASLAFAAGPVFAEGFSTTPFEKGAFDAAVAAGGPVLVEISAPWCPVCATQKEHLAGIFADDRFNAFTVFEVSFDDQKDVVRALGAQAQSTLIVYAGGAEVSRSVGDTSRESIAAMLDMAL
ncbi:MAG: thioredoxin family protein [Rubrimonas sp.]